jgi:hypothetical protein
MSLVLLTKLLIKINMKSSQINIISKFVTGGTMNNNTNVNITENGNTVTYDYS